VADGIRIEEAPETSGPEIRDLLVSLTLEEQRHYDHPQETAAEIAHRLDPQPRFQGENHLLVARTEEGAAAGLCWVVLFDPGTGLEGEVAELYVRPEARGRGIASDLVRAAMEMLRERHVTFASVWTRDDNPAALAAYRKSGFAPTTQTVLTWLPLQAD